MLLSPEDNNNSTSYLRPALLSAEIKWTSQLLRAHRIYWEPPNQLIKNLCCSEEKPKHFQNNFSGPMNLDGLHPTICHFLSQTIQQSQPLYAATGQVLRGVKVGRDWAGFFLQSSHNFHQFFEYTESNIMNTFKWVLSPYDGRSFKDFTITCYNVKMMQRYTWCSRCPLRS